MDSRWNIIKKKLFSPFLCSFFYIFITKKVKTISIKKLENKKIIFPILSLLIFIIFIMKSKKK
jgi:hypothetical protein